MTPQVFPHEVVSRPPPTPAKPARPSIRLQGARFDFYLWLGETPPSVTGGGATYEEQAIPEQPAVLIYTGEALVRMSVPVLLDGFREGRDVLPTFERLIAIASGDGEGEGPPKFKASGPMPFSGMTFRMELPEDGGGEGKGGVLLRKALTLKLVESNDPDDLAVHRKKFHAAVSGAKPVAATVTKQGETLLEVSTRVYGKPGRAKEIGDLNKIRDIRKPLNAGRHLILPT